MRMNSRERVLATLAGEKADRVPYMEIGIDRALSQKIMNWKGDQSQEANLEKNVYEVEEFKSIAARLKMDNISYVLRAPIYADKIPGKDGRLFYGDGQILNESDLDKIRLPDPHDDRLYEGAREFTRKKGDYAACFITRVGLFPTILSMGFENFSIALSENRSMVEALLEKYCRWSMAVAEHICELDFDLFITTDDVAFKTAPYFSPKIFRELFLPWYKKVGDNIKLPWIIHSDGNILPLIEDFISLAIAGLHPMEKGAMDIRAVKKDYGDRICVLGNVDLNLLGAGSPENVDREVKNLIMDLAPGGKYIVTSGNSLAGYLIPENVMALSRAVQKYGRYPISQTIDR